MNKIYTIIFSIFLLNACSLHTHNKHPNINHIKKRKHYIQLEQINKNFSKTRIKYNIDLNYSKKKNYITLEEIMTNKISKIANTQKKYDFSPKTLKILEDSIKIENLILEENLIYTKKISNIDTMEYPNTWIITPENTIKNNSLAIIQKDIEYQAKTLLGKKYSWGAIGPKTFDCSGFTQTIYKKIGIKLPRVSRNQAKVGVYIPYSKLKKGDLVFFRNPKKNNKIVSHVAIYLGNHKFIHASSYAKKIIISSFKKNPYYRKNFLWGRRLITTN